MTSISVPSLIRYSAAVALAALLMLEGNARASSFVVTSTPSWSTGSNVTSQTWTSMITGSSAPSSVGTGVQATTYSNSNGTPVWYDATAPGDGVFNAGGGDAYSFAASINPVAVIPGSNITGNELKVFAEVQTFGGQIDTSDITATYTDPSGQSHTITGTGSGGFSYTQAYNDGGTDFGGFGTAYTIDGVWQITLPQDTTSLSLSWGWDTPSSALQAMSVFTQSVAAVPEPSSAWLAIAGGLAMAGWWRLRVAKSAGRRLPWARA